MKRENAREDERAVVEETCLDGPGVTQYLGTLLLMRLLHEKNKE